MSKKIRRKTLNNDNELCVAYVAQGYDEANLVKNKLYAFGIPAMVRSDGVYPPSILPGVGAVGGTFGGTGIRVFVPRKYLGSASRLVREKRHIKPVENEDSFIKSAARQPYILYSPIFLIPWFIGRLFTNLWKWIFRRSTR